MHAIDHVLVFCSPGAPEFERLAAAGLRAGARREHAGQGTANMCISFQNAYLELIWLAEEAAARTPMVKPLGLHERARWRETNASPHGVGVRTAGAAPVPFATWDYAPPYVPRDQPIAMGCNSGVVGEPLLFSLRREYAPFGDAHLLGTARLVQARFTVRDLAPMSLLREVQVPGLQFVDGREPLLELEFASGTARALDLRPLLPLVLRW